jgi:hypothetical protein
METTGRGQFKVLSCHLDKGNEKNHEKRNRVAGIPSKIWTHDFVNKKQEN